MYQMMIVDDEDEERYGIKYLLKKSGFEFEITEAVDGRDALRKLEKQQPEILFTDVKMPFIDGLELAETVKKQYPSMQIIFFSGYDDFDLVKKALSVQAVDYILKPVNPEEFRKVITIVTERLDSSRQLSQSNQEFYRTYLLERLLNQVSYENLRKKYSSKWEFQFLEDYTRMILLEFETDFFGKVVTDVQELSRKIDGLTADSYDFMDLNPMQGILLFKGNQNTDIYYRQMAHCIHLMIEKEYQMQSYLAVSSMITAPDELGKRYKEMEMCLEERFFYRDNYVYPIDKRENAEGSDIETVNQSFQAVERDIRFADVNGLRKDLEVLIEKCRNNKFRSYIYTRFVCANLIEILFQGLPEQQAMIARKVEEIYQCISFEEIEKILWNILELLEKRLKMQQDSPKHMTAIVEKYIHEHYMEVLSLDILAEKVYLTPHYLSTIFSQEKGIGINKYIKNIRMEKAEELLRNTNMKVSDICRETGYSNLSYFCKTFRNEYGVTPEKYRDRQE